MNTSFKEACACVLLEPSTPSVPCSEFSLILHYPGRATLPFASRRQFPGGKGGEGCEEGKEGTLQEGGGAGLLYVRGRPSGLGQEMKLHFPYLCCNFGGLQMLGPSWTTCTFYFHSGIQTKPLPERGEASSLSPLSDSLNPWLAGSRAAHSFLAFPGRTLLLKRRGGGAAVQCVRGRSAR